MDVSNYRRQVRNAVADATPSPDAGLADAMNVLRRPRAGDRQRSAAYGAISAHIVEDPDAIDELLEMLADATSPALRRLDILRLLQQISFRFALFPAKRPAYLSTLRAVIDDKDAALRRRAVSILAREKDEYVQRRLVAGLEGQEKALVPAAKAIQLLGNDVHAEYLPLIRRYVEDPPNQTARKEAIRLLAADEESADLLSTILRDRDEKPDVRRVSAIALEAVAPDVALAESRRIAADVAEPPELRAMALTSLTRSDDEIASRGYADQIVALAKESPSRQVKKAANAYLAKHG